MTSWKPQCKINVIWWDGIVHAVRPLSFFPFHSLFSPFLSPCSSIMSLLPYPHLSNIWEALDSRRMLRRATESRKSAWQWLTASQWRFLIQDPAFTFTPDNRGYRPLNAKQTGAHMLCNRLTKIKWWVLPPFKPLSFIFHFHLFIFPYVSSMWPMFPCSS